MRRLEEKPDSEGLKPALTTAIVAIRSRLFQAFLGQGTVELRAEKKEQGNKCSQSDCVVVLHFHCFFSRYTLCVKYNIKHIRRFSAKILKFSW